MRRYILASAASALLFPFISSGQELNPTVEVTNSFVGKTVDAVKPVQKMDVPDSLYRFDADFQYSVLSNPYRGGYDFSPYLLDMKPGAAADPDRKLYLKAGAGYTLNPVLDFVLSPALKARGLDLNVYASHRSYFGNYYGIAPSATASVTGLEDASPSWSGRDLLTSAGAGLRYDRPKASYTFGIGYYGIHTKDFMRTAGYDGLDLSAGMHSSPSARFFYSAGLKYRMAGERIPSLDDGASLTAGDFSLRAEAGPELRSGGRVAIEAGLDLTTFSKLFSAQTGHFFITPKYVRSGGRVSFQFGAKLDVSLNGGDAYMGYALGKRSGQVIYPDVKFDARLIRKRLDFYALATGGLDNNSYSSLKERNHFFNFAMVSDNGPLVDNTVTRIDVRAGLRGNFADAFRYDLSAGFASYEGYVTDNVLYAGTAVMPLLMYNNTEVVYARFRFMLDTERVLMEGRVDAKRTGLYDDGMPGFGPAPLSGDFRFRYNWNRRIYAGLSVEAASLRKGYMMTGTGQVYARIPGYADLALEAEYALTRRCSFWASAGNLLGMPVQRMPMYAEKGVKLTAGVCFNL